MANVMSPTLGNEFKIACGVHTTVAAVDSIATGLRHVVAIVASFQTDPADAKRARVSGAWFGRQRHDQDLEDRRVRCDAGRGLGLLEGRELDRVRVLRPPCVIRRFR